MTSQQTRTITHINDQLASDRAAADLAARPVLTPKEQAIALHTAMMAAKHAGDITKARALAIELKPLLEWLD